MIHYLQRIKNSAQLTPCDKKWLTQIKQYAQQLKLDVLQINKMLAKKLDNEEARQKELAEKLMTAEWQQKAQIAAKEAAAVGLQRQQQKLQLNSGSKAAV